MTNAASLGFTQKVFSVVSLGWGWGGVVFQRRWRRGLGCVCVCVEAGWGVEVGRGGGDPLEVVSWKEVSSGSIFLPGFFCFVFGSFLFLFVVVGLCLFYFFFFFFFFSETID